MRIIGYAFLSLLLNSSTAATSIVVQLQVNRILLGADTRGQKLDSGSKSDNEAACKIVPLGNGAFAVSGLLDYVRNQTSDPIASWDSRSDAREAYSEHANDLAATAADWATRVKRHFMSFYFANPARVRELAGLSSQNLLLVGIFTGFENDQPILFFKIIQLDESRLEIIHDTTQFLQQRELPYTSHAITQELLEGNSERTKAADAAWIEKSKSIRPGDKAFRRIEFIIQTTSKYDENVGTQVNILELQPKKSPHWLQDFTCTHTR